MFLSMRVLSHLRANVVQGAWCIARCIAYEVSGVSAMALAVLQCARRSDTRRGLVHGKSSRAATCSLAYTRIIFRTHLHMLSSEIGYH